MELERSHKLPFFITGIWMVLVLLIGIWWLYLILKMGGELEHLYTLYPALSKKMTNLKSLAIWEGGTFFILHIIVSSLLLSLLIKDKKRNKSIHAFFASFSHELKTPLASLKLQAEVLKDTFSPNNEKQQKLAQRLLQDCERLEREFDKVLSLSRIEMAASLKTSPTSLHALVEKILLNSRYFEEGVSWKIQGEDSQVLANEYALTIIIRNLIENTLKYSPSSKEIIFTLIPNGFTYDDGGKPFTGNIKKMGNLFHSHSSHKGSGIGLYLCKKLSKSLGGFFKIEARPNLIFTLNLKEAPNE